MRNQGIEAAFPRLVFEEAFSANLIHGNEIWKDMMEDRNLAAHTYDKDLAENLCERIKNDYVSVFAMTLAKIETASKNL